MSIGRIHALKRAVEAAFRGTATHEETVMLQDIDDGSTVDHVVVEVFAVAGDTIFAWTGERAGVMHYNTARKAPPIDSPRDAVLAAIEKDRRRPR